MNWVSASLWSAVGPRRESDEGREDPHETREPQKATEPQKANDQHQNIALTVFGAVAAGIGGAGFVAVVGGAILLARFRSAGIPGVGAVSLVPKENLLVIGADQLIAPVVVAGGVTVLLTGIYALCRKRQPLRWGVVLLAASVAVWYYLRTAHLPIDPYSGDFDPPETLAMIGAVVILVVGVWGVLATGKRQVDHPERPWAPRFVAIVFLTATFVGGIATYALNLRAPEDAAALAVQEGTKRAWAGMYVAETPDAVYLANFVWSRSSPNKLSDHKGVVSQGQITELPRSSVTMLHVGQYQKLRVAACQEQDMVRGLPRGVRLVKADKPPPEGCKQRSHSKRH